MYRLPLASAFCICSLLLVSRVAQADVVWLDAGAMRSAAQDDHSYDWMLSYSHPITPNWSASFTWMNEGHVADHHRDGHSVQVWYHTDPLWSHLRFGAGVGPYRYFDTTSAATSDTYSDNHGWGVLYSLTAVWQNPDSNWLYQLRLNHVQATGSIDTNSVTLGVGYALSPDTLGSANWQIPAGRQEVTVYGGKTILNSFNSETGSAASVEYRYAVNPWVKVSGAWLNENNPATIRRNGALAQVWLEPEFYNKQFTLGVGVGAYVLVDKSSNTTDDSDPDRLSGLVTLTASYKVMEHLRARVEWHRIVTNYSRDSDIVLLGAGYEF